MTTRYQNLIEGGVWDFQTRTRIRKGDPGWAEYQSWVTAGGVTLPADPAGQLDLAGAKAAKIADIDTWAASLRNLAVRGRSAGEMASWTIKLLDAMAVTAGHPSPFAALLPALASALGLPATPNSINDALGQVRGISEAAHVGKVMTQGMQSLVLEIAVDAVRGKHNDAIAVMTDIRDVVTYDWRTGWPVIPGA
jgi:hypothetical protein